MSKIIALSGDSQTFPEFSLDEYSVDVKELTTELRKICAEPVPVIARAIDLQENTDKSKFFQEVKQILETGKFDDFSVQELSEVTQQFVEFTQAKKERALQISELYKNMQNTDINNMDG